MVARRFLIRRLDRPITRQPRMRTMARRQSWSERRHFTPPSIAIVVAEDLVTLTAMDCRFDAYLQLLEDVRRIISASGISFVHPRQDSSYGTSSPKELPELDRMSRRVHVHPCSAMECIASKEVFRTRALTALKRWRRGSKKIFHVYTRRICACTNQRRKAPPSDASAYSIWRRRAVSVFMVVLIGWGQLLV